MVVLNAGEGLIIELTILVVRSSTCVIDLKTSLLYNEALIVKCTDR